ncbi:hypothetical protein [Nocardioides sp. SR21]|uniref:hypothetical protein n=1 Tax=Nocardioides sp. SR21 TaxID=2919501 RepID=UPI001FA9F408|nr:hypothetical protein [Nocardioides sp. SR21]
MAGLSLVLLVASGLLAWSLVDDDPYVAPTRPPASSGSTSSADATAAIEAFEGAVEKRDEEAARALAPAGDDEAADRLAGIVANAEAAGVRDFTLRFVDTASDAAGDAAYADATWRFAGFDEGSAHAEIRIGVQPDGDRVAITGFGGDDRISPLWLSGPLEVRRTDDTLVLVDGSGAEADEIAAYAEAAVPVVRKVLPSWRQGLVVEVPASVEDLDAVLSSGPGTYDQIAAVTTSDDGSLAPGAPVHVFVNPDLYGRLKPTGAQVVMSHEATHVAADAWASTMPLWLLEGFADYVALRDVDLPLSRSAAQIIAEVRKDGPPEALPGAAEFGTRANGLGATYESAWLACRLLAESGGENALVRFYRAVDAGTPVEQALRQEVGLTEAELTQQWRTLLQDLAA